MICAFTVIACSWFIQNKKQEFSMSLVPQLLFTFVLLGQFQPTFLCDSGIYNKEFKPPLYIGGFFGFPDNEVYATIPDTLQTAVDHVNNLTGILDGYELRIRYGPEVVCKIYYF